jgi:outer membrane autotransporter protein
MAPVMAMAACSDDPAEAVAATTDRFAFWSQVFGSWGNTRGDGNAARLDRSTAGFVAGADGLVLDVWRLGLLAGYSRTSFDAAARTSSGASDNYSVGLYGGRQWGDLALRTGLAETWHTLSTTRSVVFPGFADKLSAGYGGATTQAFGELGYGLRAGRFGFEPVANVAFVNQATDGFAEWGGAAALSTASSNMATAFTTLAMRAAADFDVDTTAATVKATLGWRHAFGDTTPFAISSFTGASSSFAVAGVPVAQDAAIVEAGLDLALSRAATVGVSYGGEFASSAIDQSFRADLSFRF